MNKLIKSKNVNLQQGGFNLIMVLFMAVVATFIIATIESRLLLSIHRTKSFSDGILTNYHAESEINDLLSRFAGGYTVDLNYNKTIDGTEITVSGSDNGTTQVFTITAKRPFAFVVIQADRTEEVTASYIDADIIIALDCTSTMKQTDTSSGETRWVEQRNAAVNFINDVKTLSQSGSSTIKIGVVLFKLYATWLEDQGKVDVLPTNNYDYLIQTINDPAIGQLKGDKPSQVEQCNNPKLRGWELNFGATSVGSPFYFGDDYFLNFPSPSGTKMVTIVITDGTTSGRPHDPSPTPNPTCQSPSECSNETLGKIYTCAPTGRELPGIHSTLPFDYLICGVRKQDDTSPESIINYSGPQLRNPAVDAYALTVLSTNQPEPADVKLTKDILNAYATAHFSTNDAALLSDYLRTILILIEPQAPSIIIRRISQ